MSSRAYGDLPARWLPECRSLPWGGLPRGWCIPGTWPVSGDTEVEALALPWVPRPHLTHQQSSRGSPDTHCPISCVTDKLSIARPYQMLLLRLSMLCDVLKER